jgi:hypothetical protein
VRAVATLLALLVAVPLAGAPARADEDGATWPAAPAEEQDDAADLAPAAVSAEDRTALAACLRDAADLPRACIGSIAVVCARRAPGTTADGGLEVGCSRREAGVWRERLDVVGGALAARLDSGPRSRLAAAQRSWETYAVQKCAFAAEMQQPDRTAAMQSACALREVATRAIELERLARAGARRPAQPPRIER